MQTGKPMEPELRYLTLKLTNNCNLRCKMCGQVYSDIRNNQEIPFEIIEKCLLDVETIEHLYLFGGEPLLYRRFNELLALINGKPLPALITTNGMLLEQYAESIVLNQIRDIEISLDSFDERTYKKIRINGDFRRVLRGIAKLFEIKEKYNSEYPRVSINCVILPDNCMELRQLYEFYTEQYSGLQGITFEFPMNTTAMMGQRTDRIYQKEFDTPCRSWQWFSDEMSLFTDDEAAAIYGQLDGLKKYHNVRIQGPERNRYHLSEGQQEINVKQHRCDYPFSTIAILPDGQTTFCVDYPDIELGNLHTASLKTVWSGIKADKVRKYMLENGCFPICGGCTHFYSIVKQEREYL